MRSTTAARLSAHAATRLPELAEALQVPVGTTVHVHLAESVFIHY